MGELVEAKLVRKNRMEYDALAKVIQSHPDRDSSTTRLETVREELGQLEEREKQLQGNWKLGKSSFTCSSPPSTRCRTCLRRTRMRIPRKQGQGQSLLRTPWRLRVLTIEKCQGTKLLR